VTGLVSVVTAVHGPSVPFLADAYASLSSQRLPHGWDWRWLVQEDGATGEARAVLPADERISFRPAGASARASPGRSRSRGQPASW
jgi:hypothetical protein